ncbi:hypothetical protein CYMTET_36253, partial [Cymbomonas tetramitiformis]
MEEESHRYDRYKGRKVSKWFGAQFQVFVEGSVVSWRRSETFPDGEPAVWFRIQYDDNDYEELDEGELLEVLLATAEDYEDAHNMEVDAIDTEVGGQQISSEDEDDVPLSERRRHRIKDDSEQAAKRIPAVFDAAPYKDEAPPFLVEDASAAVQAAPLAFEAARAVVEPARAEVQVAHDAVQAAPAAVQATPVAVEPAPAAERAAPAAVQHTPVTVQPAPAAERAAPAAVQPTPVTVQPAPAAERAAPAADQPTPVTVQPAPAAERAVPAAFQGARGVVEAAPSAVERAPAAFQGAPAAERLGKNRKVKRKHILRDEGGRVPSSQHLCVPDVAMAAAGDPNYGPECMVPPSTNAMEVLGAVRTHMPNGALLGGPEAAGASALQGGPEAAVQGGPEAAGASAL